MQFTTAIVKKPGRSLVEGITTAHLGLPIYSLAIKQHEAYVNLLRKCGLEVIELDASENFPDSVFIEDVAVCTPKGAIITRPGAPGRRGEEQEVKDVLKRFYSNVKEIKKPGTLEGGDIMHVGKHFYIGLSERTNAEGAGQLIQILESYGMTGSCVKLSHMLHLKTGVSYLENNFMLASGEFINHPEFTAYHQLVIPDDEGYAANSIWVNGQVIVPKGFPKTKAGIEAQGYPVLTTDVSEFQKVDGGLSCLSLRF